MTKAYTIESGDKAITVSETEDRETVIISIFNVLTGGSLKIALDSGQFKDFCDLKYHIESHAVPLRQDQMVEREAAAEDALAAEALAAEASEPDSPFSPF